VIGTTFELTVHRAVSGAWPVVAEYHRAGQLLPIRSEGELRLPTEPASASPRTYGEALGHALFNGPIRDAYAAARGDAPVRLWLCVEDAALRSWRWEWLCGPVDTTGWDFLSLDQRVLYSLYLPSLTDRPYPPIGRRDLRALLLVANPTDPGDRYGLATFDASAAVNRIGAVFDGQISCDVLARVPQAIGPPTLDALVTQLTTGTAGGPYSLLHLVCHGRFDREADETWVYLEQPLTGALQAAPVQGVAATTLIERLKRVRQLPHFVFLSVCESATPEAEQRLGGLAQRLVRELGIPAVIGMTERVTVATAHALSESFYARLLRASVDEIGAVDCALVEAYAGLASQLDVHVPALYSRLGDRPLFSPTVDRELMATEVSAGLEQLERLLAERAPVMQPEIEKYRRELAAPLVINPAPSSTDVKPIHEARLQALTEICQEAVGISFHALVHGMPVPAYDSRPPFRGLSPFREGDHDFFFGRDALIDALLRKLTDDPFLPVLGPSGSGKSSIVLAGLVRRLQKQEPILRVAYLTPGGTPLDQLHAVQATVGDGTALYVIDQFEEVFTTCRDEAKRKAFIDAVLALTADHRVVLTMRADFWGECAPYRDLRLRMQAQQELVAPMTTAELRSAVEQQAAKVGLRFEADLIQTMLDEVDGEPGAMPLLQHTLLELWKRRHGRWLRAAEYRAVGGVKKAIAQTADRLYAQLPATEQNRMRDIFLRLTQLGEQTTPGDERRDTRHRVPFPELVPDGTDPNATKRLVKELADAVLITTSRNALNDQVEVEVAHEALIRHWTRLRDWLNQHRERLELRQSVAEAAGDWAHNPTDPSFLLHRGARLEAVETLQPDLQLTTAETDYLDACRARERNELDHAKATAAKLRWRAAFLGLSAVGLTIAAVLLFLSRQTQVAASTEARSRAWASEALSVFGRSPDRALKLAVIAAKTVKEDSAAHLFALGTLWDLLSRSGGWPLKYGPGLVAASISDDGRFAALSGENGLLLLDRMTGVSRRFAASPGTRLEGIDSGSWLRFIPTTNVLIVADVRERRTSKACNAELTGGFAEASFKCDAGNASALSLDPSGRWLVVGRGSGQIDLFSLRPLNLSLPPAFTFHAHPLKVASAAFSADGAWLATGGDDGSLRLWNTQTIPSLENSIVREMPEGRVSAVAFNKDEGLLIAGTGFQMSSNGGGLGRNPSTIRIWRLPIESLSNPELTVNTSLLETTDLLSVRRYVGVLGFTEQRKQFQLASLQGPRTFDFPAKQPLTFVPIPTGEYAANAAALVTNATGRWLVVTFSDGHIELRPMNGSDNDATVRLQAHSGEVPTIEGTASGFVTAGNDGLARLWELDGRNATVGRSLAVPLSAWTAEEFHFSSNPGTLVVAHTRKPVTVWSMSATGQLSLAKEVPSRFFIDGKNGMSYFCDFGPFNSECRQAASPARGDLTPFPGRVLDTHANGLILVGSERALWLCRNVSQKLQCGDRLSGEHGTLGRFTSDGKAVVVTDRTIKCSNTKPCDKPWDNSGKPFTVMTWLGIQDVQLAAQRRVESPYDVAYQDSNWVVLTRQDDRSPKGGGEVYRLLDGAGATPYLSLSGEMAYARNAVVQDDRWLLLGSWQDSAFVAGEGFNKVTIVDLSGSSAHEPKTFALQRGTIRSSALSGQHWYVGMETGGVGVVDLRSGALVGEVPGHDTAVTNIAVNATRQLMVTGDSNGGLRVWDLKARTLPVVMAAFSPFTHEVDRLTFSPDGKWLAASAQEEAPRVFSLDTKLLDALVQRLTARSFTDDELIQYNIPSSLNQPTDQ
jgi:WD40 repeat protein